MTNLIELAERVEGLKGADREIDLLIMRYAMNIGGPSENAEPYTASLDAAMTLYVTIPERVPSDPRKATAEALRQRAEAAQ